MVSVEPGSNIIVRPGDHFNVVLPDGTVLNIEQTADDFSVVRLDGKLICLLPTSKSAKEDDETQGHT